MRGATFGLRVIRDVSTFPSSLKPRIRTYHFKEGALWMSRAKPCSRRGKALLLAVEVSDAYLANAGG